MDNELPTRSAVAFGSAARQLLSVIMLLFGTVLATNASAGPCGGTILAREPFPALFVCVLGLALIFCSYFPVKNLKVESSFRAIVYVSLVLWSLSLLAPLVWLVRSGAPAATEDVNELIFTSLRGVVALINLFAFYRWTGVRNMITRKW